MLNQSISDLVGFDRRESEGVEGYLAGVDEAGRGPLAGPVVASSVIFYSKFISEDLNDSKKLTSSKREKLFNQIIRSAIVGIGVATQAEVDQFNIYQATRIAMRRAVISLTQSPGLILIDGNMSLDLPLPQKSIIKGDAKSASIAAASIVAKVYRDAIMVDLDYLYPDYLFKKHKGYGTKEHLERLREFGPSPVHRRTFAPVREALK